MGQTCQKAKKCGRGVGLRHCLTNKQALCVKHTDVLTHYVANFFSPSSNELHLEGTGGLHFSSQHSICASNQLVGAASSTTRKLPNCEHSQLCSLERTSQLPSSCHWKSNPQVFAGDGNFTPAPRISDTSLVF